MTEVTPALVLRGLAQELAAHGVALYSAAAPYPSEPTLPAVVFGRLAQSPILSVALAHYSTSTVEDSYNPRMRVQLRWRAKSVLAVEDAALAGFKALHFHERTDPPRIYPNGIRVQRCERTITAPPEVDANNNWERADSYLLILNP